MTERVNESEANAYHSKGSTFVGNPRYTGPRGEVQENPGAITSDSLASESLRNNGSFAANQSGIAASSQPSGSYTGSTTDASNATVLPPSEERSAGVDEYTPGDVWRQAQGGGQTAATGTHNSGGPPPANLGEAPSAYSGAGGEQENLKPKPHGKNVTEGGFPEDAPNASGSVIGSKDDPGRVAENAFVGSNVRSGIDAGYPGATQGADGGGGKGGFEKLSDDTNA